MSIGDKWEAYGMGTMNKEASFKLLDAYYEKGGNFIDTANNYQDESSEEIIGEWMESRGNRDEIVVATKSMHLSVEASLKKLRTSYIDIFYLHWWDYETSIEEAMTALHNLVIQGKVLYLGISDTPAWVVSRANQFARDHGKTPFSIYQGAWNVMERSFERDIIPMARAEGLALAPWNVLAGGKLRTDAEEQRRRETGEKGRMLVGPNWERSPDEVKVSRALEKIAKEVGAKHITSEERRIVAIAYLMHKTPYVFPIIGGRKVEHFYANMEALDITISDEQIKELESVLPFDPGFPNTMVGDGAEFPIFFTNAGLIDKQPRVQPIRPGKE
ncbi:Aldo/keto reductase [Salix suchowensis]|nr:Aldo/keto reductase [Salix suchowensis]